MKILKSHFILYVENQEKSKNFYQKILKAEPILHTPGMTEFILNKNCVLGLMPSDSIAKIIQNTLPHPSLSRGIPKCELYLYVENIEKLYDEIMKMQVVLVSSLQERNWGDRAFYITDLDGHVIAFASKIK